jgi:uncharacterized protein
MIPIELDGPADLSALEDFLASDRTPPECMQLSEMDGFLAGIVAGPELIPPSVWLPMVWGAEDEPVFADVKEAQSILATIMRRHNEIIHQLDASAGTYQPIFVERDDGSVDPSDWAVGFIQSMAICQDSWEPLVRDRMAGVLIAPIMLVASTTDKADLPLDEDERLPDAEMAKLLAEAGPMLSLCVSALRGFFQSRRRPRRTKAAGRSRRQRR